MGFFEFLQQNWGWFGAALLGLGAWFRKDIQSILLKEYSAERAARRQLTQEQIDLERKQIANQLRNEDRLFELLEKLYTALTQLNVNIPAILPALSKQIQDSDLSTHALLREISADTRDINEDIAGLYAQMGRDRPSRIRKKAAGSVPPKQPQEI